MQKYIKHPTVITCNGSNGQGKSYFIKYFINSFQTSLDSAFDVIIIFSNTAAMNNEYDSIFNPGGLTTVVILDPIDYEEDCKKIMRIQKKNIQQGVKRRLLAVFDDIGGSVKDSKVLKTFISQNRHFDATIIFSVQYFSLAANYLREISKNDIIFELKTKNSLQGVYENYFIGDFETFSAFKEKILKLLKPYHFLFCDRIKGTKKIMICP